MLCELRISNFAIIESQSVSFGGGLNVISGETGAGKSIILQALEMILGGKPKPQFLREGSEGWEVEALFDLSALPQAVKEELPDIARCAELAVHRSLSRGGRGKVYINGHLSPLALLEEMAGRIINICSQGQKNRLLDSRYHLELVDGFAGTQEQLVQYSGLYLNWRDLQKELANLTLQRQHALARQEELRETLDEIEKARITAALRSDLELEAKRLASAEQIIRTLNALSSALNGERGIVSQLSMLGQDFALCARLDSQGEGEVESYRSIYAQLQELSRGLASRAARTHTDETRLEELRDRLAEVARLERKHRCDCSGLLALADQCRRELALLADSEDLEGLSKKVDELGARVSQAASSLSQTRKAALSRLVGAVEGELAELNMKEARLKIAHEQTIPGPLGIDRLEILIAPNPGEGFKALSQIASGGELSRIMLVLKKVLRERTGVNVLVFDEVDSGISGAVARSVGMKLKELARQSQVLCITHLAQVASLAEHHFCVSKQSGTRTVSTLKELKKQEEKVEEIARMLAGYRVSDAARESARELLSSK